MKSNFFSKKRIAALAGSLAIVVIVSVLLYNYIFIEKVETQSEKEKLNVIYSDIIEHNRTMLENPVEYGDKYCSGYVSTQNNREHHKKILNELDCLANKICDGKKSDYDKVSAIAFYVAESIYYNHIASEKSVTADTICLEKVLNTKTATCAGYSNLFSALCNMQGIYCVNLRGGTWLKDNKTSEKLLNVPMNHEWNAVVIDDEWLFVDITWLSNNEFTENGYEKSDSFDDQYFGMSLEEMSYEHRIDIIDYRNFKSSINAFD